MIFFFFLIKNFCSFFLLSFFLCLGREVYCRYNNNIVIHIPDIIVLINTLLLDKYDDPESGDVVPPAAAAGRAFTTAGSADGAVVGTMNGGSVGKLHVDVIVPVLLHIASSAKTALFSAASSSSSLNDTFNAFVLDDSAISGLALKHLPSPSSRHHRHAADETHDSQSDKFGHGSAVSAAFVASSDVGSSDVVGSDEVRTETSVGLFVTTTIIAGDPVIGSPSTDGANVDTTTNSVGTLDGASVANAAGG
jgi:hypothetical protein